MNADVYAVQHIRRMRGGSQSHLLRASDGNYYVTKFQNNPQHVRVLANEMLATRLAQWLGLPVPPVGVIEISDWLVANTPEMRINVGEASVPCSSGRQLGSLYVGDARTAVYDYLPEKALAKVANLEDFARALVFDKWAANCDGRQAIFTRKNDREGYRATFIDHGYCFDAGEWLFPEGPFQGVYPNSCVYAGVRGWDSFEPALSKAECCDVAELARFAQGIPEEWYGGDSESLEKMVEALFRRRNRIRDLIGEFRCSTRNPFPNWKQHSALPSRPSFDPHP